MILEQDTTPPWLRQALGESSPKTRKIKLPQWLDPGDVLPLVWVDETGAERSFNRPQMEQVLGACRQGDLSRGREGLLLSLWEHLNPSVLAEFAWSLFEYWLATGAPSKDTWAMKTLGLLGNDATVLKLTPLIRVWPGEGKHKRAILGLDCLQAIGTDTALMQIHAIAQRIPFKSLKKKALDCMEALATERGLTPEQLADRIVPDCGLNAQGTKVYDYGSRQFRVVLSPDLKPLIRDPQNKLKTSLPRPSKGDDVALVQAAAGDWKVLKKTLSQVVSLQAKRLERAMIEQRRWERSEFETYILGHPVLLKLAQRIVWGCYRLSEGFPSHCFRVTEDGTYATEADEELDLGEVLGTDDRLGVVHPAELPGMQVQQWGQLLTDYEIVPPFPQFSRTVFTLEPADVQSDRIGRFRGKSVPALIAAAIFNHTGWEQLPSGYAKPFPQAKITAIVLFDRWQEEIPLGDLFFTAGDSVNQALSLKSPVSLSRISPVIISEVLRNIGAIASKASVQ